MLHHSSWRRGKCSANDMYTTPVRNIVSLITYFVQHFFWLCIYPDLFSYAICIPMLIATRLHLCAEGLIGQPSSKENPAWRKIQHQHLNKCHWVTSHPPNWVRWKIMSVLRKTRPILTYQQHCYSDDLTCLEDATIIRSVWIPRKSMLKHLSLGAIAPSTETSKRQSSLWHFTNKSVYHGPWVWVSENKNSLRQRWLHLWRREFLFYVV